MQLRGLVSAQVRPQLSADLRRDGALELLRSGLQFADCPARSQDRVRRLGVEDVPDLLVQDLDCLLREGGALD